MVKRSGFIVNKAFEHLVHLRQKSWLCLSLGEIDFKVHLITSSQVVVASNPDLPLLTFSNRGKVRCSDIVIRGIFVSSNKKEALKCIAVFELKERIDIMCLFN